MSIKLCWVSDPPQAPTGQGVQTYKILTGLLSTGEFDVVCLGVPGFSAGMQVYQGIRVYPCPSFDDIPTFRAVFAQERPDIAVYFADPRHFMQTFSVLDELRPRTRGVFWHLWDNFPLPTFNVPYYESLDTLICASKFTYNLMQQLKLSIPVFYAPHIVDSQDFHPLPEAEVAKLREELIPEYADAQFVIFWNNRAVNRKRPGDVIRAYSSFAQQCPDKTLLIFKTRMSANDYLAEDLHGYRRLYPHGNFKIFDAPQLLGHQLNQLYNLADVTVNIAKNEGFGLSVAESLCAGVPVVVTATGGMTEQARDKEQEFGRVLPPLMQNLVGTIPDCPWCLEDFVDVSQIVQAFNQLWQLKKVGELKALGELGRAHVLKNYSPDAVIPKLRAALLTTLRQPLKPLYRVVTL
jgi:glycosyltransferase involved in cell wall biosynthesis